MYRKLEVPITYSFFPPFHCSNGVSNSIYLHYDVPAEGKYYMMLAFCDAATSNLNVTGSITVMNPYGHFPARLYGLIPFTKFLLALSFGLLLFWCLRCLAFQKQIMNVHKMILVVLVTFFIDESLRLLNITHYNKYGGYSTAIAFISVLFSVITRVVARCLAMIVVMG